MKATELTILARKIQLVIKAEEMPSYLEVLAEVERLLASFKEVKISKKAQPLTRINPDYLNLTALKKLSKKYSNQRISEETLQANAEITPDHFILFKPLA